jgi:hypothetical protein
MNDKKARALIEAHFVAPLPLSKLRKLDAHLYACSGCKSYYDRLFGFEAAYDSGKGEAERIGANLFERIDWELAPKKAGVFAFTWPFPTVAALGMAALTLAVVKFLPNGSPEGEFAVRGGPTVKGIAVPELDAVCFVDRGNGPEEKRDLKPGATPPSCPRGGRLVLAYRSARAGDSLVVFAIRDKDATQLVPASGVAVISPGPGPNPLPGSFEIAPDAPAGEVSLVAVFAPELDPDKLRAALAAGEDVGVAAGAEAVVERLTYRLDPR